VLLLQHSTVARNSASDGVGGVYNDSIGSALLYHSLIAENSDLDAWGSFTSQGYNLIGDSAGCTLVSNLTGNVLDTDARLGTLANHGGSTASIDLLADSPALNAGDPGLVPAMVSDQRGRSRVAGTAIDIGSVEMQSADLSLAKYVDQTEAAQGGTLTYSLVAVNLGPDSAEGVSVSDILPAGLDWVSDNGAGYDPESGEWSIGTLTLGGSAALVITARVGRATAGQSIRNTATISSEYDLDSQSINNSDSVSVSVRPAMTLYVSPSGTDNGLACTNPATPCETVCHALNVAGHSDVIALSTGIYTEADNVIDVDITIQGQGAADTIVQAGLSPDTVTGRVFFVTGGSTVTLHGITIRHGHAPDGIEGTDGENGGGIYNHGASLSLLSCAVVDNEAGSTGGFDPFTPWGNGGWGGGIYSDWPVSSSTTPYLYLKDCVVSNNMAGKAYGNLRTRSPGIGGSGGGIYHEYGQLQLRNCVIADNAAGDGGAGGYAAPGGHGGGLYQLAGSLEMDGCTIAGNRSGKGGKGGSYSGEGGDGGGLYVQLAMTELTGCTISSNSAGDAGDVFFGTHAADAGDGGGIYYSGYSEDRMTLESCTISGNAAGQFGEPAGVAGRGGGIRAYGDMTIRHCTISDNHAGLHLWNPMRDGGVSVYSGDDVKCTHTIIANNHADERPDYHGVLNSEGFNLVGDMDGCTLMGNTQGCLSGLDPLLGPLADNGGPTMTHLPLPGSPCLDTGDHAFGGDPAMDQRGMPRVDGMWIDLGAVEVYDDDDDDDGMADDDERVADTDPRLADSVLEITAVEFEMGGTRIHWRGGTWATQYLEATLSLTDIDWQTLLTNLPPTASPTNHFDPTGSTSRWYRIRAGD
jgi:uncharacterized repeat protein (TIGR01451 family)